jgi:hypothetical protein
MSKLVENAEKLVVLFNRRAERKVRLAHLKADLEARTLEMRPKTKEGWGPNPESRKENAAAAQKVDEACAAMLKEIQAIDDDLEMLGQEIDGLQELSKAIRWDTRAKLAATGEKLGKPDDVEPGDDGFDRIVEAVLVKVEDWLAMGKPYEGRTATDAVADMMQRHAAEDRDEELLATEAAWPTEPETPAEVPGTAEVDMSAAAQAKRIMDSLKDIPAVQAARKQAARKQAAPEVRGTPDDTPFRF